MTTWEDDLGIGYPALDSQHRQLILLATRACLKIDSDTRLADADIPCNVVAGYHHDHLSDRPDALQQCLCRYRERCIQLWSMRHHLRAR